jgi:hypothetical protein
MRHLLPLMLFLAGCPPWITKNRHEQSQCEGGERNLLANGSSAGGTEDPPSELER